MRPTPEALARFPLKGATLADRRGEPTPEALARFPLEGATLADRRSRIRGVPCLGAAVCHLARSLAPLK
ncbi:hypothetical protein CAL14_12030 [Bordetella genomosp. 9]|nr:hypothetical protein CAL14_12030 [Bordetella genomosp. 9]